MLAIQFAALRTLSVVKLVSVCLASKRLKATGQPIGSHPNKIILIASQWHANTPLPANRTINGRARARPIEWQIAGEERRTSITNLNLHVITL